MRIINSLGVITMLVGLPLAVFAADNGKLFEKLDADKDGKITREEFISCPLVRGVDAGGKEQIKPSSLCANPKEALSVQDKHRLFDVIDHDKSGAIDIKKLNKFATPDGFAPIRF